MSERIGFGSACLSGSEIDACVIHPAELDFHDFEDIGPRTQSRSSILEKFASCVR